MSSISCPAVCCFTVMIVFAMVNGKCNDYCQGRDGRNGRDGRDGRDGKDVSCPSTSKHLDKPSIHLDGATHKTVSLPAGTDIDIWSTTGANGHIGGGMVYSNGQITVPVAGIYFVYCQVYYNKPRKAGRHGITVNNRQVALAGNGPAVMVIDTYYTGLSVKLNKGDKIACKLNYGANLWSGMEHTFFGAFLH